MIDWMSLLLVATVALVAAVVIVTTASVGLRLFDAGTRARASNPGSGRVAIGTAYGLFAVCGLLVLFGVYLIIPGFR